MYLIELHLATVIRPYGTAFVHRYDAERARERFLEMNADLEPRNIRVVVFVREEK